MRVFKCPMRGTTAAALAALAILSGCAAMSEKSPAQQVQERAAAFWKARSSGDMKTAYGLLTPAYRGLHTEQDFARKVGSAAHITRSEVAKVTCEPEKCTANIALTAKPSVPNLNLPEITAYMDETWLLVDGQWWRHEEP